MEKEESRELNLALPGQCEIRNLRAGGAPKSTKVLPKRSKVPPWRTRACPHAPTPYKTCRILTLLKSGKVKKKRKFPEKWKFHGNVESREINLALPGQCEMSPPRSWRTKVRQNAPKCSHGGPARATMRQTLIKPVEF